MPTIIFKSDNIQKIIHLIKQGKIIALPTDTLYSLSCSAHDLDAVNKIYSLKKRPGTKPLPLLVGGVNMADKYVIVNKTANKLIKNFWPGALTLVLPRKAGSSASLPPILQLPELAIRAPNNKLLLQVINGAARPLIGTSANISGFSASRDAVQVGEYFKNDIDAIIQAPLFSPGGIASTIVRVTSTGQIEMIREGAINADKLEQIASS